MDNVEKRILGVFLGFIILIGSCTSLSMGNVEWVKEKAPKYFDDNGYKIVAYEGFEAGSAYRGAKLWYQVIRKDHPEVIYQCWLWRWKETVELYNIRPINIVIGVTK